jgi:ribosome-binding factor A
VSARRDYPRSRRVGEQIQRELAELIRLEVKDPRVSHVTVVLVDVSKDLAQAKVLVSSFDEGVDKTAMVAALNHAAGFLRRHLAQAMKIRTVPQLHFCYDDSFDRAARLNALLASVQPADVSASDGEADN